MSERDLAAAGLRLRLVDASPQLLAACRRETGLRPVPVQGPPDLVVRTVPTLGDGPRRLVGADLAVSAAGPLALLGPEPGTGPAAALPVADLRPGATVRVEAGASRVPLLLELLHAAAAARGLLALHAGALAVGDRGLLLVAWAKGGKTETVLAAMQRPDVAFVADEWTYLDGRRAAGTDYPLRLWAHHLAELPGWRGRLPAADRRRLAALAAGRRLGGLVPAVAARLDPPLRRRHGAWAQAADLFGGDRVRPGCLLHAAVVLEAATGAGTVRTPLDGAALVAAALAATRAEREPLLAALQAWRFAEPALADGLAERLDAQEAALAAAALGGLPASRLRHPPRGDLAGLAGPALGALADR